MPSLLRIIKDIDITDSGAVFSDRRQDAKARLSKLTLPSIYQEVLLVLLRCYTLTAALRKLSISTVPLRLILDTMRYTLVIRSAYRKEQYLFHVDFNGSFQARRFFRDCCFQTLTTVIIAINFLLFSFNGVSVIELTSIFFRFHFRGFSFTAPVDLG